MLMIHFVCKDSAKFRLSEENTNEFVFLSVRNLSKSSEKTNLFEFFRDAAYIRPILGQKYRSSSARFARRRTFISYRSIFN